ncbi:MAG: family 10 glycosylhydrolase [Ignavibacteria bacterium]|nr:family 10 glycosylhydrolase [Ignavibacteria bacterium]MDH7527939.1 alpha amylase family protein [Ignavibacteria bacterium]
MRNSIIIILILFITILEVYSSDKPKLLWFDATANFERLSYPDSIQFYLKKAKEMGFTDVVLDLKPITGEVLYQSEFAPQMIEWNGFYRDSQFDFPAYFISEAKKLGLNVYASVNVFVAGHNFFDRGLVYQDKSHWQSINYTDSGFIPITQLKHKYSAMTNPVHPEVQEHELKIISELFTKYPQFDGIILDRVRYDGIEADFSNLSKEQFEKYINQKIENYPDDIYRWSKNEKGEKFRVEGKLYKKWLEWRASVIYNFMTKAREVVKQINPEMKFGVYTGAWYPVYYEVGVNWASKKYDPSKEFDWATADYKNYGYAELLDIYTTGCYFFEVTKEEVEKLNEEIIKRNEAGMGKTKDFWYSVEGSAEIAKKVMMNVVPVIGGLYVEQYKDHPEQFKRAIKMCLNKTDGLMIFDLVHIVNYGWWNILENAMKN